VSAATSQVLEPFGVALDKVWNVIGNMLVRTYSARDLGQMKKIRLEKASLSSNLVEVI